MIGHRRWGLKTGSVRARHFSSPKMPSMPAETPPPPSRFDQEAEKQAAAARDAARQSRGRRSTIIAGGMPAENLGGTPAPLSGKNTLG